MKTQDKIHLIRERLSKSFDPDQLEIIDDSDKHIGHAGHAGGGRHFTIIICSTKLNKLPRVHAHREVYALLSDLIPNEIHALAIKLIR